MTDVADAVSRALAALRPERFANLDVPAGQDPDEWTAAVEGQGFTVVGVSRDAPAGHPVAATLRLRRRPT